MVLFWSFFSLDDDHQALIATRILEQFVAQAIGVMLLRHLQPDRPRPWRMWLYPLPCLVALAGWLFVYITIGLCSSPLGRHAGGRPRGVPGLGGATRRVAVCRGRLDVRFSGRTAVVFALNRFS